MRSIYPFVAIALLTLGQSVGQADSFLIVPGRSIGQTRLGRDGDFYLRRLPPPTGEDASLGGNSYRVWQARAGAGTLYLHAFHNAYLDPPQPGMTIEEIRATSPRFHTRNGVSVGATLAQIRRRFPQGSMTSQHGCFYLAIRQGIAFEFVRRPMPSARCIAVTVYPPNQVGTLATAAMVGDILRSGQRP